MASFVPNLLREARALRPRRAWDDILRGFAENDLLTYASALSFRIVFAVIPLALLGLGLLGLFGLSDVWQTDVAPNVKAEVSPAAFQVIDDTVRQVLGQKQLLWATAGALIAVWEVSAGMRAVMGLTNRVYRARDDRGFPRRIFVSIWLSALVTVLVLTALASATVLPRVLHGALPTLAGWALAFALLIAALAAMLRFAPNRERPLHWVGFGTLLVVVGWVGASLVYNWYITSVADYGSIFGSLAVVIISFGYVYVVSIVFVTGLQLDALVRDAVDDTGGEHGPELAVARPAA